MEEEVSNNGGPWRARMNSRAPRQKEKEEEEELQNSYKFNSRSFYLAAVFSIAGQFLTN